MEEGKKPTRHDERAMAQQMERERAEEHRRADPVLRAQAALQKAGRVVYRASVIDGPADLWVYKTQSNLITDEQLVAEAQRVAERRAA